MKPRFRTVFTATLLFTFLPALAGAATGTGGVDHSRKIKAYNGPSTCLACHSSSKMGSNLAQDVFDSVHFQLRTGTALIDMPGGGSHGMVDRACGLPGTTLMAGNYAGVATNAAGAKLDDGCGKCHLSFKPPFMYASYTDAVDDIDCLLCHAAVYGRTEWDDPAKQAVYGTNPAAVKRAVVPLSSIPRYVNDASGRLTWAQDRSLKTAQTVGQLPRAEFCQRCHEHGQSRYKRATPYKAATDVHAAGNVECFQCHTMQRHKIARGNFVTDAVANEMPEIEVSCNAALCHGAAPHTTGNAVDLNKHTTNLACEACHVPTMEGSRNIWQRSWGPFTVDPRQIPQYSSTEPEPNPLSFPWLATPATKDGEFPTFWDAYSTYHDIQGGTTWPAIRWFDGKASMLAQPSGSYADRVSGGGKSRLFALKPFTSGMLFEAAWLPGPPTDFDLVNGTWRGSMKAFFEGNWDKYVQFGFVDPAYQTPQSYWTARPDMAAMLNRFPMMLQFSRSVFLSGAGDFTGIPVAGPQNATTYPAIANAIDVGMGTMGIDLGYCPQSMDPALCGKNFWSGTFFSMWVPVDMKGELGSFITPSHAIKGTVAGSPLVDPNFCTTCHYTADECHKIVPPTAKRLDFAALGYQDLDGNGLTDPRCEASSIPVVSHIDMSIATTKTGQTLTIVVAVVDCKNNNAPLPGATVTGTLTLTGGTDRGLPKSYTGVTGADGTVKFTYTKKPLATGTYTFTTSVPCPFTQSITK